MFWNTQRQRGGDDGARIIGPVCSANLDERVVVCWQFGHDGRVEEGLFISDPGEHPDTFRPLKKKPTIW
jgi:hypothetical protein